jgi:hypothetical protein
MDSDGIFATSFDGRRARECRPERKYGQSRRAPANSPDDAEEPRLCDQVSISLLVFHGCLLLNNSDLSSGLNTNPDTLPSELGLLARFENRLEPNRLKLPSVRFLHRRPDGVTLHLFAASPRAEGKLANFLSAAPCDAMEYWFR